MCPKIRGVRCPCDVRRFLRWTADRGLRARYRYLALLFLGDTTPCGSARSWLARKDSNFDLVIQSQLPESGPADAVLNGDRWSTAAAFVSQVPIRKLTGPMPEVNLVPIERGRPVILAG